MPLSCAHVPCFINTGLGIQKVIRRAGNHKTRQHGDRIRLLLLFQNKESRLKMGLNETGYKDVD
jgi:hypothetical protein